MKKITILGAGMVGSAIARDLQQDFDVVIVDRDEKRLSEFGGIVTIKKDLSIPANVREVIADSDMVIDAVPGFMGFSILETAIKAGKDIVDISFFDEDPFILSDMAEEHGVTAIIDMGVAPGMSNLILGHHAKDMHVQSYKCFVGGLPVKRSWPYQYKAPFSPIDVIEEYTRPARIMENGRIEIKPALSESEYINLRPVGTLEAFYTDGLRTLLKTMDIPNMKEKTLRYPGHIEYIRVLKESGFFSRETVEVSGCEIRPIDLTTRLLFDSWRLDRDEQEFTVMQITIDGKDGDRAKRVTVNLFDRYSTETKISSMARTTGYAATAAARIIADGGFSQKGLFPPEVFGQGDGVYERMLALQSARGINYQIEEHII